MEGYGNRDLFEMMCMEEQTLGVNCGVTEGMYEVKSFEMAWTYPENRWRQSAEENVQE